LNSEDTSEETVDATLYYLETLSRFPDEKTPIKSFWIGAFSAKPAGFSPDTDATPDDAPEEDDWRLAFREEETPVSSLVSSSKTARASELSTHQAIHSLASHRSHFTNCWFALLPRIQGKETLVSRALTVLPRNVIPYLTRPTRLHDWVAGSVQFGESFCSLT
jgi:U3 small nucleolar RNA-associated protein 19